MDETNELLWKLRGIHASLVSHRDDTLTQSLIEEDRRIFTPDDWDFLLEVQERIKLIESLIRTTEERRRFGR